jgi:hypothetical protein
MASFDDAQDAFQNDGVLMNAQDYLNAAIAYWEDGMIGEDTFDEAKKELAQWCADTSNQLRDPRTRAVWAGA